MSDMRAVNLTTIEIPQPALFLNVNYRVKVLSRSLANFWIYDYHRVHVFDQITVYSLVQMCTCADLIFVMSSTHTHTVETSNQNDMCHMSRFISLLCHKASCKFPINVL